MDTQTLYREELLEHYRNPQNFGKISNFSVSSKQANPFCGDDVEIYIKLQTSHSDTRSGVHDLSRIDSGVARAPQNDENSIVEEISFEGKGCAISMAGASMLTEFAKGKTKEELTKFSEKDMLSLLGIEVSETRKKCALLALSVLKDCLYGIKSKS